MSRAASATNSPGRVTLSQVAAAAGVSNATVSYVLNGKAALRNISEATESHVREVAARLQYRPNRWARNLVQQRTRTIGVLFGNLRNDWADRALSGMREVLDEAGYLLFLTTHQLDPQVEQREIDTLLQLQVEALICPALQDSLPVYAQLISQGVSLVFLETRLTDFPEASSVVWDGEAAAYAGTRHLIEGGCTRIAYLGREYPCTAGMGHYRPWFHAARFAGYTRALAEAGLAAEPAWAAGVPYGQPAEATVKAMFENPGRRPDAVFAALDMLALEAIRVLDGLGIRVPEDVAVAGMGDQPAGGDLGAGLTTVRSPDAELGREAAKVVLRLLESPASGPIHRVIGGSELVVRRTTRGKMS